MDILFFFGLVAIEKCKTFTSPNIILLDTGIGLVPKVADCSQQIEKPKFAKQVFRKRRPLNISNYNCQKKKGGASRMVARRKTDQWALTCA